MCAYLLANMGNSKSDGPEPSIISPCRGCPKISTNHGLPCINFLLPNKTFCHQIELSLTKYRFLSPNKNFSHQQSFLPPKRTLCDKHNFLLPTKISFANLALYCQIKLSLIIITFFPPNIYFFHQQIFLSPIEFSLTNRVFCYQ